MECKNCEYKVEDGFKYCPQCGQNIADKLTVTVLFTNFIKNYFSVDGRFFKSFFPLIFKPGFLAEVFVKGKRLKYLHPVQFFLFISVVFFFLLSLTTKTQREKIYEYLDNGIDKNTITDTIRMNQTGDDEGVSLLFQANVVLLDSLISTNAPEEEKLKVFGYEKGDSRMSRYFSSQMLKIYERSGKQILEVFMDLIPIILFFYLPLFAFILKLLFYKKGNISHHLVFSFYLFAFFFLTYSLLIILNSFFKMPFLPVLLINGVYLFFGIKVFYGNSIPKTLFKTLSLLMINIILLIPFSLLLILITVLTY